MTTNLSRERIKEIREYGLMVSCAPDSRGDIMPEELEELCALALRATEPEQLEPVIHVRLNQLETWRYALGKALESLPKGREREWVWPVWNEIGELDMPNAAQEDQP